MDPGCRRRAVDPVLRPSAVIRDAYWAEWVGTVGVAGEGAEASSGSGDEPRGMCESSSFALPWDRARPALGHKRAVRNQESSLPPCGREVGFTRSLLQVALDLWMLVTPPRPSESRERRARPWTDAISGQDVPLCPQLLPTVQCRAHAGDELLDRINDRVGVSDEPQVVLARTVRAAATPGSASRGIWK